MGTVKGQWGGGVPSHLSTPPVVLGACWNVGGLGFRWNVSPFIGGGGRDMFSHLTVAGGKENGYNPPPLLQEPPEQGGGGGWEDRRLWVIVFEQNEG